MLFCFSFFSHRPDEFKELIDAVFRFDWRGNDKVVGAFSTFVSHLVSANSTYMLPAMHMLIRSLLLSPNDLNGGYWWGLHDLVEACLILYGAGVLYCSVLHKRSSFVVDRDMTMKVLIFVNKI